MSELVNSVIADRFQIIRRIGGGSFGEIYLCQGPNGTEVAAKFEKKEHISPQLRHEYKVYRELKGSRGICSVYYFGDHLENYNVVVMELMGPSLEDLFEKCRKRFSLKTVLQIADQLITRVNTLHEKSIIHRDIKPQNFVIGIGCKSSTVYCVDFGLAKLYRDRKTLEHLPYRDGSLAGTPRYASIANHQGIAQSRRDDYESIAYMLIYFLKGKLPWQGLKANDKRTKYGLILETKQKTPISVLCEGLPKEFADFLTYCRSLGFEAEPNVDLTKKLFDDLYVARGYNVSEGKLWDWDAPVPAAMFSTSSSSLNKPGVKEKGEKENATAASPALRNLPQSNYIGIDSSQIELDLGLSRPTTAAAASDNEEEREAMVVVVDGSSAKR